MHSARERFSRISNAAAIATNRRGFDCGEISRARRRVSTPAARAALILPRRGRGGSVALSLFPWFAEPDDASSSRLDRVLVLAGPAGVGGRAGRGERPGAD